MHYTDINDQIKTFLDEERRAYAARGRGVGGLGSLNIGLQSLPNNGWTELGKVPELLFPQSDPNVIASDTATVLVKFYLTLTEEERGYFRSYLFGTLSKHSEYAVVAYYAFFVLYRIGFLADALSIARRYLAGDTSFGYSNLLATLSLIVSREYLEIPAKTYDAIRGILIGDKEPNFNLTEKVNLAKVKHLEVQLSDINPELNTDRNKVIELWGKTFATPEFPSLIKEIEDYFREGDLSDTKFATCISRIRVFLVEVAKRIAIKTAEKEAGSKPSEDSDEHYFIEYLYRTKRISLAERKLWNGLHDMASEEGAHSSISKREYARLLKNMSYELGLLFVSRYQQAFTS
ncbi:MAG: hypothetical protein ACLQAT_24760 [Candidatus Binataceae bacterium]